MSKEECQLCDKNAISLKYIQKNIYQNCYSCNKTIYLLDYCWILAKDKMPEKDGRYLVVEKHPAKWVGVSTMRNGKFDMPITYWMNLPSSPEWYILAILLHLPTPE